FAAGDLNRRHLQHRFDGRPTHHVDHLLDGQLRLLDEFNHGEEKLTLANEKIRQLPLVGSGHDLVLCHCGGSFPLRIESQPILRKRSPDSEPPPFSTFNYRRDIVLKSSDVAKGNVTQTNRYMLVPQTVIGEETATIETKAPLTWAYLQKHGHLLDRRGSS